MSAATTRAPLPTITKATPEEQRAERREKFLAWMLKEGIDYADANVTREVTS